MTTQAEANNALKLFSEEWTGKLSIWGFSIGAAPDQYDEWGRASRNITNYAIWVYCSNEEDIEKIPSKYNNIDVMIFTEGKEKLNI